MMPSSLSSTYHGHIHVTLRRSQNWTLHRLRLLLPRRPSRPVRHLPMLRARCHTTTKPGNLFHIKWNISCTRSGPRKLRWLNHIVKKGRTAPLRSEFFGHCPDHLATHQHHVASHKWLRTVLRSREDVKCFHRSRLRPHHRSMHKSYYTFFFSFSFSHHFGCTDVSHSRIICFAHRSCYLSS